MKVIATDLDRTLIPNGNHSLSPDAMKIFRRELKENKIRLVYVTGRNERLILDGIRRYGLPKPDYCIALVATKIFEFRNGKLKELDEWAKVLEKDWKGYRRDFVAEILKVYPELVEQELPKLDEFKQSYYVSLKFDRAKLLRKVQARLKKFGIRAEVLYSIEPRREIAMLDVVPKHGVKDDALEFLMKKMKLKRDDLIYCGDSGNDIQAIVSGFNTVLVKNAQDWVKREVNKKVKKRRLGRRVYLAQGNFMGLNGNYVSGIIEGAYHFGFFK